MLGDKAIADSLSDDRRDAPTVLACRNLWKIYGPHPERYLREMENTDMDPDTVHAHICESGDHIPAVADVSFEVPEGEIFVIMGLSGSGKSTAIRCLARLVEPTSGTVTLDGRNLLRMSSRELIEVRRHKLGMVFQHFGLIPNLSVLENIALPLKLQGVTLRERNARAAEVIELVGLAGREDHYPRELSGGQQQRVGIARSLCVDPELWLLDEPFSALDPLIRRQLQDEFLRIQKRLNKTIVFITHDFMEAVKIADRIAIMRDGRIVQVGAPAEIILSPANEYVSQFSRDVPYSRILTAYDVYRAANDAAVPPDPDSSLIRINQDTVLEDLLGRFSVSNHTVALTDSSGKVVGNLTLDDALHAVRGAD
jgi:glycine betaine/proline transport system ATP-binding protein